MPSCSIAIKCSRAALLLLNCFLNHTSRHAYDCRPAPAGDSAPSKNHSKFLRRRHTWLVLGIIVFWTIRNCLPFFSEKIAIWVEKDDARDRDRFEWKALDEPTTSCCYE